MSEEAPFRKKLDKFYQALEKFWRRWWREAWIAGGWLMSVLLSLWVWVDRGIFAPDLWLDPQKMPGAIYAGWVGGVALSTFIGVVATLVSLTRPEEESFDTRARILFRRQSGPQIDYIVSAILKKLEHYLERTEVTVAVVGYDESEKKYLLSEYTKYVLRSYIDDFTITYTWNIEYAEVTPPPPNKEPSRLVYVRLDTIPDGESQVIDDKFNRAVKTRIGRNKSVVADILVDFWVIAVTEKNTYEPIRYTQLLTLQFENRLDRPVTLKFLQAGENEETIALASGGLSRCIPMADLRPDEIAYTYALQD